ncbi:transmembrane protein 207 isoform X2 [Vicugna pacos]|uniref:Transmembrane protein 207 isoform X2 n=1 Tax=Vicugna pacos TaxID=30538 RepID=A0ABM5DIS4_VICPA
MSRSRPLSVTSVISKPGILCLPLFQVHKLQRSIHKWLVYLVFAAGFPGHPFLWSRVLLPPVLAEATPKWFRKTHHGCFCCWRLGPCERDRSSCESKCWNSRSNPKPRTVPCSMFWHFRAPTSI